MEEKSKTYDRVIFTPEVIKEAIITLETTLADTKINRRTISYELTTASEGRKYGGEEEFFADYRKGFQGASVLKMYDYPHKGIFQLSASSDRTRVKIGLASRNDVEKVFYVLESNVDKCRLPKQPEETSEAETNWIFETTNKIETHCPIVARKIRLALIKLESENAEEWQNATMLIRDAWIELAKWLCQVKNIDTSDISSDSVVDRLRRLKLDKSDERLFNLARASFNLSTKHHKRDIEIDTAVACVISTIVSMKTVIMEVLNATS